jgi:hypothetical protein
MADPSWRCRMHPTLRHRMDATLRMQDFKKDTRWIHWNETMADLIVRESLEAIQVRKGAPLPSPIVGLVSIP